MKELIGQTLGHYKINQLLGEGGMGAVYKGRDLTLQRDVAIKIMHPQFARKADFRERFLQEARTAARLKHPSIVQVHDFGQEKNMLYIVMGFISGANLHQMLQDLKRQDRWIILNEALLLVRQVCLALDYAHRQGVLHRDIKPANIMLESEPFEGLPYHPVITDLGLAKLAEGGLVTIQGSSMGTPAYMSPEQALGRDTDARSDVYSLGILLYELAVGRLPFPVNTITEAIRCHTQESPPRPRSIRPDLPEQLERIIGKALQKDPRQRYSDAAALAKVLGEIEPAATEIASAPTTLGAAVSLMTQYQQSLIEQRGASIIDEFSEIPASILNQDHIQIMQQNHTARSVAMKPDGLTIGRDEDCDIVLDNAKVSRQHARIEFDGKDYQVQDLNSTNGTFLANVKLLPGVMEEWQPEAVMRIGDAWLRVVRAGGAGKTSVFRADGTVVGASQIHISGGDGRVGVFMETVQLSVEPGSSITTSLILLNQGGIVEHFSISVDGIPSRWVPSLPPTTQLMPGQQQEVSLTIQPPRTHRSRAGRYPICVRVTSQDAPDQVAEVKATLTVTAYSQFSSELHPQKIRSGQPAQITVSNRGNTQESFTLNWQDRGDELVFNPPQMQLQVPEGQSAAAEFRASLRKRRWIGGQQTHPFTTQVIQSKDNVQTHNGEAVSQGLIPIWVPPLLIFLCVMLASAAGWLYKIQNDENQNATQTAIAEKTAVAEHILSTSQAATQAAIAEKTAVAEHILLTSRAATQTANWIANANQATIEALTATAVWMGEDDDKDRLSNQRELEIGTLPNKRDTDEDGLSDGDEQERGTDPLDDDTDGDGWNDGKEISEGTDPLDTDTDDDGIPDNRDPFPLRAPTDTPTPEPTVTTTPTPTKPAPTPTQILRTELIDDKGIPMSLVPAGSFEMGIDTDFALTECQKVWNDCKPSDFANEKPVHSVYLDSFYIDQFEVTNAQFAAFLNVRGNQFEGGTTWYDSDAGVARIHQEGSFWRANPNYADHPATEMTWYGAKAYCSWRGGRLPTEAEWEKAARGGLEGALYPWGNESPVCDLGAKNGAQFGSCTTYTVRVGSFGANGYGLYDMAGNAFEFIADWFDWDYYTISPQNNPTGPVNGDWRVIRGGCWDSDDRSELWVTSRRPIPPYHQGNNGVYGFRCARSPSP